MTTMDCTLACPNKSKTSDAFCNGQGTDMFMGGFVATGNGDDSCLMFLHSSLIMDSPWKFFVGCLATVLLGVLNEYVVSVRRNFKKANVSGRWFIAGTGLLYVINLIFGYLLMLLAMTYSYEIFAMVLLGLVIGHLWFNRAARITESTDACCLGDAEGDEHRVDSTNPRFLSKEALLSHISQPGDLP